MMEPGEIRAAIKAAAKGKRKRQSVQRALQNLEGKAEQIREAINICDLLGLSALVEAHEEEEVRMALDAGARVIGVNNRNLKDFSVDTENSRRLRRLIPDDVLFVSESGVSSAEDVRQLQETGVDAVLVGEALMRAEDRRAKLREFKMVF